MSGTHSYLGAVGECHRLLSRVVRAGDHVLDATVGKGRDLLLLADMVGPLGRAYGFEIAPEALAEAERLLTEARVADRCTLFAAGHQDLASHLPAAEKGRLRAAVFNLGYLPGSHHAHPTRVETTMPALQSALDWLAPGGLLAVVVYCGHPEGVEETTAIRQWVDSLHRDRVGIEIIAAPPGRHHPPLLIGLYKRSSD